MGNAQFRTAGYLRSKYFDEVAYLAIKVSNSVLDGMGNKARRHVINQISATASDENSRIKCISIHSAGSARIQTPQYTVNPLYTDTLYNSSIIYNAMFLQICTS